MRPTAIQTKRPYLWRDNYSMDVHHAGHDAFIIGINNYLLAEVKWNLKGWGQV